MIVKPTYVFRNLPYLSHRICAFLQHPFTEFRRSYECNVVNKLYGTFLERIEEIKMSSQGLPRDFFDGPFSVNSMRHCIREMRLFLLEENYITFDSLLVLCKKYKCENRGYWGFRKIEKVHGLGLSLKRVQN